MKSTATLLKHIPSIKFVGGPHKHAKSAVGVHPLAPNGLAPSKVSASSSAGEYSSRLELPARFRYKLPKADEADNIISGGAEIIF